MVNILTHAKSAEETDKASHCQRCCSTCLQRSWYEKLLTTAKMLC